MASMLAGAQLKQLARAETPNPEGAGGKSGKIVPPDGRDQQPSPYAAALVATCISRQQAHNFLH